MPIIKKGSDYMNAITYTGNGSTKTINVGFQPDLVWIKSRSAATDNKLTDSVRGATLGLISNSTGAETTDSTGVTAFTSTGFALGANSTYNTNGATYVAWCWKKGATPGFDIVTYTGTGVNGQTYSHSLGVAPKMMIVKPRQQADNWNVYHESQGATQVLYMNLTNTTSTNSTIWNNTAPTSTVFTVGTNSGINTNGLTYVAYLFAEIAGFSKFGSYTGNGSADGPFVFTNFQPKFVMVKNVTNAQSWQLMDASRSPYNVSTANLLPNNSAAEQTGTDYLDFLSNGFKIRQSSAGNWNNNGDTYIFAAFASNPFKTSLAR